MTAVTECDCCRTIGPIPAPGWIVLGTVPAPAYESSFLVMLGGTVQQPEETRTFCRWRCVAEYATARALVGETEGSGT